MPVQLRRPYEWIARWWRRGRCPHAHVRGIYGDEVIFATPRFSRLQCRDCLRFLDGPVSIAEGRR